MLHDIKQLKRFLTQIEKIGKIKWGKGANDDVNNNIATDGETKVDKKDVVKKKRFEDISK